TWVVSGFHTNRTSQSRSVQRVIPFTLIGKTDRELAVRHLCQMRPRHLALTRCPRNNGVLEEGLTAAEAGSLTCCSGGRCGSIDQVSCSYRSGQALLHHL